MSSDTRQRQPRTAHPHIALLAVLVACGDFDETTPFDSPSGSSSSFSTGSDHDDALDGGLGSSTGDDDDDSADADSGGGVFDVGNGADDGIGPSTGCGKIDFLFVIDDSGSMGNEQQALLASFAGFIDAIESTVAASDYHILATSVNTSGIDLCDLACQGQAIPVPCGSLDVLCSDIPPLQACDTTPGAGRIMSGTYVDCGLGDPNRYISSSDPDLVGTFECIANRGTVGDADEHQAEAIWTAISDPLNDAGGCNEGFLRDDAVLVVTLITDEDDRPNPEGTGSPGQPSDWMAKVVAEKGGNADAVVMLGLLGSDVTEPDWCAAGPRLAEFVESFPRHVMASVCEPDYAPFFEQAVGVIDVACDEFEPEG